MHRALDQAAGARRAQQLQVLLGQVLGKATYCCTQSHHPSPIYSVKKAKSQGAPHPSQQQVLMVGSHSADHVPPGSCAMLQARQQRQQAEALGMEGCLLSLITALLGFLQSGTRRKHYYYYFVLTLYRQTVQGAMRDPYLRELPLSHPMAGFPLTLPMCWVSRPLWHTPYSHLCPFCCATPCNTIAAVHPAHPSLFSTDTDQPFQSTTSILPPLTAISKAVR